MYPDVGDAAHDLKVFPAAIGGTRFLASAIRPKVGEEALQLACRVHDECNGPRRVRLRHLHLAG